MSHTHTQNEVKSTAYLTSMSLWKIETRISWGAKQPSINSTVKTCNKRCLSKVRFGQVEN